MTRQENTSARNDHAPVRHIAIQAAASMAAETKGTLPIKGGMKGDGTAAGRFEDADSGESDTPGNHSVYVLVRDGDEGEQTPVFHLADAVADAILIFSTRQAAVLYLQVANWNTYKLRELSPLELSQWSLSLEGDHIRFLVVDPNRLHQERGESPGPLIDIGGMRDHSGENLYQEIHHAVAP